MYTIALFGEAEKGEFKTGYLCKEVIDLAEHLGEPPSEDSKGLTFAVQALLYERPVIYFRVREEGFSLEDYLEGLRVLKNQQHVPSLAAICLPGVGNHEIIEATTPICSTQKSSLIITEHDLYDYLTYKGSER